MATASPISSREKSSCPPHASAAENAAAANLAARVGFASTGMTPPVVIAGDSGSGPRIRVGREAAAPVALEKEEGGVFFDGGTLALAAADDAGLQAAAEAYSARAPYQWRVPGEKLAAIADAVRAAAPGMPVELVGVTYQNGKADVHRAFLRSSGTIAAEALEKALASPHLAAVHSLAVLGGATAVSTKAEPAVPPQAAGAGAGAPAAEGAAGAAAGAPTRLDLATLYTSRGLSARRGRIPVPASLERPSLRARRRRRHRHGQPRGAHGTGNHRHHLPARLARRRRHGARRPRATPCWPAMPHSRRRPNGNCRAQDTAAGAIGNAAGSPAKANCASSMMPSAAAPPSSRAATKRARPPRSGSLADRFPNLWEQGKQYLSLEEIRYDLHRFFSLRSSVGPGRRRALSAGSLDEGHRSQRRPKT